MRRKRRSRAADLAQAAARARKDALAEFLSD
jgi:hypothetical protein